MIHPEERQQVLQALEALQDEALFAKIQRLLHTQQLRQAMRLPGDGLLLGQQLATALQDYQQGRHYSPGEVHAKLHLPALASFPGLLRLTAKVVNSLQGLWHNLQVNHPSYAKRALVSLLHRADELAANPTVGKLETKVPNNPPYRYLPVGHYRIYYTQVEETLVVLDIFEEGTPPEITWA